MTKEDFLAIATKKYDELQGLNKIDCFYDYGNCLGSPLEATAQNAG